MMGVLVANRDKLITPGVAEFEELLSPIPDVCRFRGLVDEGAVILA